MEIIFIRKYVNELATNLNNQLQLLSKIAVTDPQSAYAEFVSGFKSKLSYFIRTIPDMVNYYFHWNILSDKNSFLLSQVVKFALTTKEYYHHYQHGMEDRIYHFFMKQQILNMKISG